MKLIAIKTMEDLRALKAIYYRQKKCNLAQGTVCSKQKDRRVKNEMLKRGIVLKIFLSKLIGAMYQDKKRRRETLS
jgi:hypothetical protein